MREKFARFMVGRNGGDELSRFASLATCVLIFLSIFFRGFFSIIFWLLALVGLAYTYFRIFSKNLTKRREENYRFLSIQSEVRGYFGGVKERRSQRGEYKFFRCPSCHTMLRVPRGKGKVKVICRKCGTSFVKKT